MSPSGHTAHPDEIIASCQALQTHIQKVQEDADQTLRDWEARLEEQELVEKRRVAPGWLDRDEKILEPERQIKRSGASGQSNAQTSSNNMMDWQDNIDDRVSEPPENNEGNELDRAFGGLVLQKK